MLSTTRMPPSHHLPLSPLSNNIYAPPRRAPFMSATAHEQENPNRPAFSKRPIKKAPSPKADELKSKRRDAYLKTVKEKREEKRFESRGDDMMRTEFLRTQREWEERLNSSAPMFEGEGEEEEEEEDWSGLPVSSGDAMDTFGGSQVVLPRPEEEVEEVVRREEEELEALLAYLSSAEGDGGGNGEGMTEHPWSDDDDYDALFSELVARQSQQPQQGEEDEMDLS